MGIKTHMGYNQEAYDAECAVLARALESAGKTTDDTKRVTVFTDAQAAVKRMASEEPGPARCKRSRREGALRRYGGPTGHRYWDPLVPSTQRSPREREAGEWPNSQQKDLWAEVREETGRGKDRFKIRDLLANTRYSRAVLDFVSNTDVGRRVPKAAVEEDVQSEASGWELRERREREEERRVEAEELGARRWGTTAVSPYAFMACAEEE
jgi:hypothetical protein